MNIWCKRVLGSGVVLERVRYSLAPDGTVHSVETGCDPHPSDFVLRTVIPGIANAHSHAFHRVLRGRTHNDGGNFWIWRESMYRTASRLEPESYYHLARAVFAEMVTSGFTAVGEFHYVHHRTDGEPYPHEMELAISTAAKSVGIRLMLLDTAYLTGAIGQALSPNQIRFGDRNADTYLARWHELNNRIENLGAAIHSVRAVPPPAIRRINEGLPDSIPLHIHLSEQPQENIDSIAAFGRTPTQLLSHLGVLHPRLSAVHATHLTPTDIELLGRAETSIVMCPTTEADLGDGIGPARLLRDSGAHLALGSDQNAVIDPFLEMRGLEMHERLASGTRGQFTPAEALSAGSAGGYRSLGWLTPPLQVGGPCDLLEIDDQSTRTIGSDALQLLFSATASDVARVIVGGQVVAERGLLADGTDPAELMSIALEMLR